MGPSVVAPWSSLLFSVGALLGALAWRRQGSARSSAAAPGRHRSGRRLLLEAFDCIGQYGHLPYDGRNLGLRGHCRARRARLRRRWGRGGFFPMGRAPCRPSDSRSLSSCLCHAVPLPGTPICCGQSPRRLIAGKRAPAKKEVHTDRRRLRRGPSDGQVREVTGQQ